MDVLWRGSTWKSHRSMNFFKWKIFSTFSFWKVWLFFFLIGKVIEKWAFFLHWSPVLVSFVFFRNCLYHYKTMFLKISGVVHVYFTTLHCVLSFVFFSLPSNGPSWRPLVESFWTRVLQRGVDIVNSIFLVLWGLNGSNVTVLSSWGLTIVMPAVVAVYKNTCMWNL